MTIEQPAPGAGQGQDTTQRHAALLHRASAVLSSIRRSNDLVVTDERQLRAPAAPGSIGLARGATPGLIRGVNGGVTVVYDDPHGDAALGALLALAAERDTPVGADPESLSVLSLAERLAASDIPVLINGPTGTGKEVLSRFIHARSPRAHGPFVAVNCAAMPEAMLEGLLFGHQKGAFTGATAASEGFFRAADGGTLLLDEIAEMPLGLQAKLLRALQEGEVVPLGATRPVKVDVRIIACANRDLPLEVEEGRFRADLFYRLNVFPLGLRALRDRPDDIAPLAFAMLLRHAGRGRAPSWIGEDALAMLKRHGWPGNVRELENVVRRALLLADGASAIGPEHIVFDRPARLVGESGAADRPADGKLCTIVQVSEARAIMDTLAACGGSRVAAARQLGISERTLRYRLASLREAGLAIAGGRS